LIPVHSHSEFSALDGFSTTSQIADRLVEAQLPGAFITDHGVICGWRSFAKEMAKRDLFVGFGVEAYQAKTSRMVTPGGGKRDQAHLILLAKNAKGMENLMMLNYHANVSGGYYVPRVDWELLEEYHEGVIATSACVGGLVAKGIVNQDLSDLYRFLDIFKDDFFLEIHTYTKDKDMTGIGDDKTLIVTQAEINYEMVSVAREMGIPMVYANDAHYACKSNYQYHEVLLAAQTNRTLDDPDRMSHPEACMYIMAEENVREALRYLSETVVDECIANSDLIADRCRDTQLAEPGSHLPVFIPKEITDESNNAILIRLVKEGCKRRYGAITPEISDRAVYELRTIIDAGLGDYFLITEDFTSWADGVGILRGPGRGSAAGSIIAYVLGITHVDPLKYGLYFERFYNVGRAKGLPDIDIDFVNRRREELDKYLKDRWGEHNVIPIGTHIRMKPLQALTKMAKVFRVPFNDVEEIKGIVKSVPDVNIISADQLHWYLRDGIKVAVLETEDAEGNIVPREQAELLAPWMEKHKDYFEAVFELTGRLFSYGIHASAIVISDVDVRSILPVTLKTDEQGTGKKVLATQIEMKEVEALGFPKFDRLGLKTLDVLDEVATAIGEDVNWWWAIDYDALDESFWKQIERGNTLGVFQVEDGMAKSIGKRLKPRNILDLSAIVALNRPGPLRSVNKETGLTAVETFLRCRQGEMEPEFPHPILEEVLESTYGVFLYQEQVINFFGLIGYDLVMADTIRDFLGKKKAAQMAAEHPRYMEYATQHMDEEDAQRVWDLIIDFSFYSFNKAHSVGYGLITAATMYAKHYHQIPMFMASIHNAKDRDEAGQFVMEARRMGIEVHHPDINKSHEKMAEVDGAIYFGLTDVKSVATRWLWVKKNRPFSSYEHFMAVRDEQQKEWSDAKSGKSASQQIPTNAIDALRRAGAFEKISPRDDVSLAQRAEDEEELLGVALTSIIPEVLASQPEEFEGLDSYECIEDVVYLGETIRLPGQVYEVRTTRTKKGKSPGQEMGFVKIEWPGGHTEFTVFPDKWMACRDWLFENRNVGIFKLIMKMRGPIFESGKKYTPFGTATEGDQQ